MASVVLDDNNTVSVGSRAVCYAKRALEIAAAGGHNLLLIGPPGTGKSMLARRLPGILPPMSDREALRMALKILKGGDVVGLFPEGTRSTDGVLKKGLSGAGFFALRGNADVVPCAIIGPYKMFRKVKVVYGEPLRMEPFRERKASADEVTEEIMAAIQALLDQYSKK